jgi:hypothetical protein
MYFQDLSLEELRERWTKVWDKKPHRWIGRQMLEESLAYKLNPDQRLPTDVQKRLNTLIKQYKRNPTTLDKNRPMLKPGTRLSRTWQGKQHSVLVKDSGFEYKEKTYNSLSQIANDITGSHWNGHLFFEQNNLR